MSNHIFQVTCQTLTVGYCYCINEMLLLKQLPRPINTHSMTKTHTRVHKDRMKKGTDSQT